MLVRISFQVIAFSTSVLVTMFPSESAEVLTVTEGSNNSIMLLLAIKSSLQ